MRIEEYVKLIEDDMNKHREFSCESCVDRSFLTLISYFTIIKNFKGLRTVENILNSYKVTECEEEGRDIDLMKVPKRIREKVNEHASNAFVKKKVSECYNLEHKDDDEIDYK